MFDFVKSQTGIMSFRYFSTLLFGSYLFAGIKLENLKIKQQCKSSDNQYRFKFRNIISDDEVFGAQPKIHNETFLQK